MVLFVLSQHKSLTLKPACVAPSRVLNSEELSDHETGGHVRKVGNCVPCAVGCGRKRNHFRLDPSTGLEGCLSLDISGPHVPGIWPAPDDSQYIVTRKAIFRCSSLNSISPRSQDHFVSRTRGSRIDRSGTSARGGGGGVTSLAMRTSLLNPRIMRQRVSGSVQILWQARRHLTCSLPFRQLLVK